MLAEHARRELELSGQYAEDPEYSESLIRAVEAFVSYGHSGGSAGIARQQLYALLAFKPLAPLTSNPDEWLDRSAESGRPMWQNKRDPSAFSTDGGKTWYTLSESGRKPAGWLRRELTWSAHNLIAHPLSELTHWLGYAIPHIRDFGNWLHDLTVPPHEPNTGRG